MTFIIFISLGIVSCLLTPSPRLLIIWLVCLTIVAGIIIRNFISSWFMYAIILLFTGGIMVLFIYMITLIQSSKIIFNSYPLKRLVMWIFILSSFPVFISWAKSDYSFSSLYSLNRALVLLFLVSYLLLILVVVVKLTAPQIGPLKSFIKNEK